MIFDEVFFNRLNKVRVDNGDYLIHFFSYMDRIWCEIIDLSDGEILYESQITNYQELSYCCNYFCKKANIDNTHTFLGIITEKLFETTNKSF